MADVPPGVFDVLRERGVERARVKLVPGGVRSLVAAREADWEPAAAAHADLAAVLLPWESEVAAAGIQRLEFVYRADTGVRLLFALHRRIGSASVGSFRRVDLASPEAGLVRDTLRFSALATHRAEAAGLAAGGCHLALHSFPVPDYSRAAWVTAIAEEIDLTGARLVRDAGVPLDVATALGVATPGLVGAAGDASLKTAAAGVHTAVRATAAALGASMPDITVALQGLGALGSEVGRLLVGDGAKIVATDRDYRIIDRFLGATNPVERKLVSVVAPYQIMDIASDIFVPCAMAGVIDEAGIAKLRCRSIVAAADGALLATGPADERRLAGLLHARGILYVPDWIAGVGALVLAGLDGASSTGGAGKAALARTHRVCGWLVDESFRVSKRSGRPFFDVVCEQLAEAGREA